MEHLSDLELIKRVKENACSDSYNELLKRYEKIFYKRCQSYQKVLYSKGIDYNDVIEEKNTVFLKCVTSFDFKKSNSFGTHLGSHTGYFCLNLMKSKWAKKKQNTESMSYDMENFEQLEVPTEVGKNDLKNYIDFILNKLDDKKVGQVIRLRYFDIPNSEKYKNKFSSIAKKMKICKKNVIKLHERGIRLIKAKLKSQVICDLV